jgi:hypothetical protein
MNDLSDEAFEAWATQRHINQVTTVLSAIRECRRRAEVQIEKERREAHRAGYMSGLNRESQSNAQEAENRAYRAWRGQEDTK